MKNSIFGSLVVIIFATYLIKKLSKRESMKRYEKKPRNQWNSLSEGIDPTDE